jgi:glutamate/aspartate transport system substrate-binding protein
MIPLCPAVDRNAHLIWRTAMKKLSLLGLALAASFLPGTVAADELSGSLKKIKDSGTLVMGIRESSFPLSYLDQNQKPVGYLIDVCL